MDSGGFTWNVSNAGDSEVVGYLAIKGGSWNIDEITLNTSTGNQSVSGMGFQPAAVMQFSVGDTALQTTAMASENRLSIGAADGTNEHHTAVHDEDAAATSIVAQKSSSTKLLSSITAAATGSSSTTDEEISHVSFQSGGNTFNVDTAGAAIKIFQIAMGDSPAGGGWTSKINGVTNLVKVDGIATASIGKVNGN